MTKDKINKGKYWKRVLLLLYDFQPHMIPDDKGGKRFISTETNTPIDEIDDILTFLELNDLVECAGDKKIKHYSISEKGFKVALDVQNYISSRKLEEKQAKFNRIIALTGSIIALATLFTFGRELINYCKQTTFPTIKVISTSLAFIGIILLLLFLCYETINIYKDK